MGSLHYGITLGTNIKMGWYGFLHDDGGLVATPWTVAHHGDFPDKNTRWVAISFSKGSSQPRDPTHIFCLAAGFFMSAPPGKSRFLYIDPLIHPLFHTSNHPPFQPFIHLSTYLQPTYPFIHLPTHPTIQPSTNLSTHPPFDSPIIFSSTQQEVNYLLSGERGTHKQLLWLGTVQRDPGVVCSVPD